MGGPANQITAGEIRIDLPSESFQNLKFNVTPYSLQTEFQPYYDQFSSNYSPTGNAYKPPTLSLYRPAASVAQHSYSSPKVTYTKPQSTYIQPQPPAAYTKPKVTNTQPNVIQSKPQVIYSQPKPAYTKPQVAYSKPQAAYTYPQVTYTHPKISSHIYTQPKVVYSQPTIRYRDSVVTSKATTPRSVTVKPKQAASTKLHKERTDQSDGDYLAYPYPYKSYQKTLYRQPVTDDKDPTKEDKTQRSETLDNEQKEESNNSGESENERESKALDEEINVVFSNSLEPIPLTTTVREELEKTTMQPKSTTERSSTTFSSSTSTLKATERTTKVSYIKRRPVKSTFREITTLGSSHQIESTSTVTPGEIGREILNKMRTVTLSVEKILEEAEETTPDPKSGPKEGSNASAEDKKIEAESETSGKDESPRERRKIIKVRKSKTNPFSILGRWF